MTSAKEANISTILRYKEGDLSLLEKKTPPLDVPFVLEGYAKSWPAFTKWCPGFFTSNHGNISVETTSCLNGSIKKFTLSEYFQYYHADSIDQHFYYLKNWVFEDDIPSLVDDYSTPFFFKSWTEKIAIESRPKLRWLYIGPKGSSSSLHIDVVNSSAWNCVITGRKIWHFYSPDQVNFLYNFGIDSFNPDYAKYPLLSKVKPFVCIQNPGDVVFTPSGWPHQVINTEHCISLTENFINEHNCDNVIDYLEKHNRIQEAALLNNMKNNFKMLHP